MTERITSPQKSQISRLVKQVVEELGLSKEDAQRLLQQGGTFKDKIKAIIRDLSADKFPSQIHAPDLIRQGWAVVEDVQPTEFQVNNLELVPFLRDTDRDGYIGGEELRKRSVDLKANKGLVDAKRTLENQADIPVEFRKYLLVFTGTVLRGPGGSLCVPCLDWRGGRWYLRFGWLDGDWFGGVRLVRCK